MTTTYKKINYASIQKIAYDTILESDLKTLPINVSKIIRGIPNLRLMKYSTLAASYGVPHSKIIDMLGSTDGCCQWKKSSDQYIIFYNDKIRNKDRIRFTLAHELGHFKLKHHSIINSHILNRSTISESAYDKLEQEANFFAKSLLVPIPVVFTYRNSIGAISHDFIRRTFKVSYSVSANVLSNIRSMTSYNTRPNNNFISEHFKNFIKWDVDVNPCTKCNTLIDRNDNFCHQCRNELGTDKITSDYHLSVKSLKEELNLKYHGPVTVNSDGIRICPRCSNENIIDGFSICHVCSTFIHNVCLGDNISVGDIGRGSVKQIFEVQHLGCGISHIPENGRYCPSCGGISSFYFQGLLNPWEDELNSELDRLFG